MWKKNFTAVGFMPNALPFNKLVLDIPLTKLELKTYSDHSFSAAGPTLWNKLPSDIWMSESVDIFKQKLKTHLFKQAFFQ